MNQTALQNLLRNELAQIQAKNPSYSIRAFAKKLDVGFGTLSQVLAGKRSLALKSAEKVLDRIGASPVDRSKVLRAPQSKPSYEYTQLQADQHFVLSEWYYLAILNLVRTKNFQSTPEHISRRLGISTNLTQQAIERLERLGLLKYEKEKLVRCKVALNTTDEVSSAAVRKSHSIGLDLARKSLDEHELHTRDFTWLTFAFDPRQMEAAKQKIREFQDEFSELFSTSKEATEVYRMALQLFSLTQGEKK